MQHIDRLNPTQSTGAGGSVAAAKSSQLHEEKGSGAPRGVIRRLPGVVGARGEVGSGKGNARCGAGGARAPAVPAPRHLPPVSRPPTPLVLV